MIASVDRLFTKPAQHDPLGVRRRNGVSASNGTDLGQVLALLSDVLTGLRSFQEQVAGQFASVDARFASIDARFASVDRRFASVESQFASLRGEISSLRGEVAAYHASVVGHGILISELDSRLSRVEQHLDLPPIA